MLTFYIQKVSFTVAPSCSAETHFWPLFAIKIQEKQTVTIFHIWSDNELVTLIFGFHLETVLIIKISFASILNMSVIFFFFESVASSFQHLYLKHYNPPHLIADNEL